MGYKGFFGDLFDSNHDGVLDDAEKSMDFAAFMSIMEDEKNEKDNPESLSFEFEEDEYDDDEYDEFDDEYDEFDDDVDDD